MNELLNHINQLNAKTQAWINEAPKSRWSTLISDDIAMWNAQGIFNPQQLDHYFLVCNVYEMTRELFGYKPHWGNLNNLTNEQLQAEEDSLKAIAIRNRAQAEQDERDHETAITEAMHHQSGFAIGSLLA